MSKNKNALMEKFKKIGVIKGESIDESEVFQNRDIIKTGVPIMDIALGGLVDGGLQAGVTLIAGPSRHFKTNFGLVECAAYLDKYPEAIMIFEDNEFGCTDEYFAAQGIDVTRVLHCPFTTLEQLKADLMQKLEEITRGDKIIFFVDSLGNAASAREVQNALDDKDSADFTRAKAAKSLFRMITPHLTMKDIPFIAIQHVYSTMETYAKTIVSGGTGGMLAANDVWILGRQQDKPKDGDLEGYNFIINVEKSRRTKEKSKFSVNVTFEGGINKWSGLLDIALESGHVAKPKQGWYAKVNTDTGEIEDKNYRESQTNTESFWGDIITNKKFIEFCDKKFKVAHNKLLSNIEEESK